MPWLVTLFICVFALTSLSYAARNDRDRAAQNFQKRMDTLNRGEHGRNNYHSEQNEQEDNNFANQEQYQDSNDNTEADEGNTQEGHNGNENQSGYHNQPHIVFDEEVRELKQDMASVMLRLDRLERKLKAQEKKAIEQTHKTTHNKKKSHKKKKLAKPVAKKAKAQKPKG